VAIQIVELLLEALQPVEVLLRCPGSRHGFTVRGSSDDTHQMPVRIGAKSRSTTPTANARASRSLDESVASWLAVAASGAAP